MRRLTSTILSVVVILLLLIVAYFAYKKFGPGNSVATDSKYSAVALMSNELFFGHIKDETPDKLVLEDVYFFTYVPADGSSTAATSSSSDQQNLRPTLIDTNAKDSLAPTTTYIINRAQIKYTFPLKSDSQVVKTIEDYKKK